jgi:hypothetical protein
VTRTAKWQSLPKNVLIKVGFVIGSFWGMAMFVLLINAVSWVWNFIFTAAILAGAFLLTSRLIAGIVLGSMLGFVMTFFLYFTNFNVSSRDYWTSLIGLGPSDPAWIEKIDRLRIYLPRESKNIRFDNQSSLMGNSYVINFRLEPRAVNQLRQQHKLDKEILGPIFHRSWFCNPQYGFTGGPPPGTQAFDITSMHPQWLNNGAMNNVTLEVHPDGSAHGCAYVASSR